MDEIKRILDAKIWHEAARNKPYSMTTTDFLKFGPCITYNDLKYWTLNFIIDMQASGVITINDTKDEKNN